MGNGRGTHVFDAPVVVCAGAEIVEESFAAAEQHWHNCEVHLVDEGSTKVLPDRVRPAPHKNITAASSFTSGTQRCLDPAVDEMEGRSPLHFDRRMRVVRKYKDLVMEGGFFSPPARPLGLTPRAADRTEHVPAHDGGTDTRRPLREEGVVEPLTSTFSAGCRREAAGGEDPVMELHAPDPERIFEILVRPSGVAV